MICVNKVLSVVLKACDAFVKFLGTSWAVVDITSLALAAELVHHLARLFLEYFVADATALFIWTPPLPLLKEDLASFFFSFLNQVPLFTKQLNLYFLMNRLSACLYWT